MEEKLIQFVDHASTKGLDHATIRQLLLSAGWTDRQIAEVFCARDLDLPIPTPSAVTLPSRRRGRQESVWPRRAREAFFNLLTFGSLYTWATSLILLLFICIDFAFPDPAWRVTQAFLDEKLSIIRFQLAVLMVSFPIFMVLWHYLLREASREVGKPGGAIRRWLGYLTIFIGAITLSVDVMTLVYFMLEGQLTARLLLKAGVLFLIAGSLVLYLAMTLRSEMESETQE